MGLNSKLSSAEEIYNSYLLLYKLNEIKDDNGELLKDVISEAINQGKNQAEFKVKGSSYKVNITEEGNNYELKVLGGGDKPEVKDVLKYTDKNIVDLWAQSKVSVEKGENDNLAFAIHLRDQSRLQNLKIGGLGKKVPFALRFANFYKVIEILKDEGAPLEERLRMANNIATGSGKTGDIALLKFWAYLVNIPCITVVPSDNLRTQSNSFDRAFLPDEVAQEFAEPFSETNVEYATTTFAEAFNTQWNLLNDTYGKNKTKPALTLIDEAPKLKENVVQMARAVEVSRYNPTAYFSATPDKFLSEEFKIKQQILLSPKEREALGIGKLPKVFYQEIKPLTFREGAFRGEERKGGYISPAQTYISYNAITHSIIGSSLKQGSRCSSSQQFLDIISQLIDSSVHKKGLIVTNEAAVNDNYIHSLMNSLVNQKSKPDGKKKCKKSYLDIIRQLNIGLSNEVINEYVDKNLEISTHYSDSLKFIPLHGLIDITKAFLTQNGENLSTALNRIGSNDQKMKGKIDEFLQAEYGISNSDYFFKPKDELVGITFNLIHHIKSKIDDREYINSIERNYAIDKKLNADVIQVNGIQKFCDYYRMISCFTDSQNIVQHIGEVSVLRDGQTGVKENRVRNTLIQNSERNIAILFNMFKAGLIGNFVVDKKMGIGFDDVTLDKVVYITQGPTDLLDPAYELQVLGRGGRSNQKGEYYFYRYTDSKGYFNHSSMLQLNGEKLREKFEEARQNYIEDEQADIERRSVSILRNIVHLVQESYPGGEKCLQGVEKILRCEFNDLNVQCNYDKNITIDTFIKVLKKVTEGRKNAQNVYCITTYQEQAWHSIQDFFSLYGIRCSEQKNEILNKISSVIVSATKDLESEIKNPNSYWSCVAHAPVMNHEDLIKADPNSSAPIFMEQKERSQVRYVSVHDVGESVSIPNVTSKPFQQASTKKKVMYGIMLAFPFLAVGIYALVTGEAIFNPIIATGIFAGAVVTTAILFTAVKIYEKKAENPDMGVGTAIKETFSTLWSSHKVAV